MSTKAQGGEGTKTNSPSQAGCGSSKGSPVPACQSFLRIRSNTLSPNRETVVVSMVERGPYGQIEDFDGDITVEVLPSCILSEYKQEEIARALADIEVESWLSVSEWNILRVGNLIVLTPATFEERA